MSFERWWPLLVVALSAGNMLGDALARSGRPWWSFAFYTTSFAWIWLLGQHWASLTRMVTVYGITTYVGAVLVGRFWFREPISSLQWVGVAFGLVAVCILSVGER